MIAMATTAEQAFKNTMVEDTYGAYREALEALHQAYVTPSADDLGDEPTLRALAKKFDVRLRHAQGAAGMEWWDLERRANHALHWKARYYPNAPEDEAGFVSYLASHAVSLSEAKSRAIWWRALSHLTHWRVVCAEMAECGLPLPLDEQTRRIG